MPLPLMYPGMRAFLSVGNVAPRPVRLRAWFEGTYVYQGDPDFALTAIR